MGFNQYHEPAEELNEETRTLARIFASLTEETEAINWYQQRISVEKDRDAKLLWKMRKEKNLNILVWTWNSFFVNCPNGKKHWSQYYLNLAIL